MPVVRTTGRSARGVEADRQREALARAGAALGGCAGDADQPSVTRDGSRTLPAQAEIVNHLASLQ
jgi:hypothetical protein